MSAPTAKTYIRIMRLDHWIKQLFILPGAAFALFVLPSRSFRESLGRLALGFLSTCFIASANYVINEWLDREFDRYHPVKKHRSIVEDGADPKIVYLLYAALTAAGFLLGWLTDSVQVGGLSPSALLSLLAAFVMGMALYIISHGFSAQCVPLTLL